MGKMRRLVKGAIKRLPLVRGLVRKLRELRAVSDELRARLDDMGAVYGGRFEALEAESSGHRRQTAEIQLAVQEERALRQGQAGTVEDLKKQIGSLSAELSRQQKVFEAMMSEQREKLEARLKEQERAFSDWRSRETESRIKIQEELLKVRQDSYETTRSLRDAVGRAERAGADSAERIKALSSLETKVERYRSENSQRNRAAEESLWADIFRDSVTDSAWLKDKALSPGRWAVGYPYLYVLYRILNETKPQDILELGLGVSTRVISQYAGHHGGTSHSVVESNPEWIDFFGKDFALPDSTRIERLDYTFEPFGDAEAVRVFANFQQAFSGRRFDLISIDAPLGGDMKEYARIDVLRMLPECLKKSFVIMIDDYERQGEKRTVEKMLEALRDAGIMCKTGVYSGKKDLMVIASEDLGFVCSM